MKNFAGLASSVTCEVILLNHDLQQSWFLLLFSGITSLSGKFVLLVRQLRFLFCLYVMINSCSCSDLILFTTNDSA